MKFVFFLKIKVGYFEHILLIPYVCKQTLIYLGCAWLKNKCCYNVKPSAYFYVKTKISVDFQICISIPLTNLTINSKVPITLINGLLCTTSFFILECLRIHTFGHSIFTVIKIFNKVFTLFIFLGYPVSYLRKQTWHCRALTKISSKVASSHGVVSYRKAIT